MDENIDTNAAQDGGNAGESAAWLSSVPENLRTNEAFKGIEKSSDAWQQFVDMKVNSENSIRVPGEDATDEDRNAFYGKLGRPETAAEYTLQKPENFPDDIQYDEATEQVFRSVFHDVGLSDKAAATVWDKYHELVAQGHESTKKAETEAYDASINALKDEWTGDKFKVNTEIASRAFTKIFDNEAKNEEASKFLSETKVGGLPLGDNPMFLKIFHQVGLITGDDHANVGRGSGIDGGLSDEESAKKRFPNTKF